MKIVIYGGKQYRLLEEYQIKKSSKNITYSTLKIDFTGHLKEDLPVKFQQIQLIDTDQSCVLFTGYLDTCKIPSMISSQKEFRELELTLLSPDQLTTRRTITKIGTFQLEPLIQEIFEVLQADGFSIKEIHVPEKTVCVNYIFKTVEACMNDISNRYNIWWYIDENKNIYVYRLDDLMDQENKKIVTQENLKESVKGLLNVQPVVESVDYANVINAKNVAIFTQSFVSTHDLENQKNAMITVPYTLKTGDWIDFKYPFDILPEVAERIQREQQQASLCLWEMQVGNETFSIYYQDHELRLTGDISLEESSQAMVILKTGQDFPNRIVGMKWNGPEIPITAMKSNSVVKVCTARFVHSEEVARNKNKISDSGMIEKTVDCNETVYTESEMIDYMRNLLVYNQNKVTNIQLRTDQNNDFHIGDKVTFLLPNFFVEDTFILTDVTEQYSGNVVMYEWSFHNANILNNYIDLFRSPNKLEKEEQVIQEYLLEYSKEEALEQIHTMEEPQDESI